MIIDSDYGTLTIKNDEGYILIRNIDEYNILKYGKFNGYRIIKDFPDNVNVTETFDEGIFNVSQGTIKLQIRDKNEMAKRINYCIENNTSEPIKELLLESVSKSIQDDVLTMWLVPFGDKLSINKDEIIINNMFKVDMNGQAYYKDNNDSWQFLCIVASKTGQLNRIINHSLGNVTIDFRTMEIYSKVLFLLFPNINDNVFYNQLPAHIKNDLQKNRFILDIEDDNI